MTGNLLSHNHGAGAQSANGNYRYTTEATTRTMNFGAIGFTGNNQLHDNMLPFQRIN